MADPPASPGLTAAETAWLRVQEPTNLSVATIVLLLEDHLDHDCLKTRIEDRILALGRLRQRVEPSHLPLARPRWRDDEKFALANHLFRADLPDSGAPDPLPRFVGSLLSRPLDESRPLWQVHHVDGVEGGSAVVARVHQSLADGCAAAQLVLGMADFDPTPGRQDPLGLEQLIPAREALECAGESASQARMLCRLITSRADGDNPLRGRPALAKRAAWSAPVPLARVEACAAEQGASVDEILLTAVAGALRAELHRRDTPVEGLDLRLVLQLNLRRRGDSLLGTRLACALLPVPLWPPSAPDRLLRMQELLGRTCRATDALLVLGVRPHRGVAMPEIEEKALRLLGHKATAMLGILPAPEARLELCGAPIDGVVWWPALQGDLGLGISAVSYAGTVRFAVMGDAALLGDVRVLASELVDAMELLARS